MGNGTFRNCYSLSTIHCKAKEPPYAYDYSFDNHYNYTLYVPKESLEKYKGTEPWSKFKAIIGE